MALGMKRAPVPRLSVLIPTITRREPQANALFRSLEERTVGLPVELLMLRDNCFQNLGEKRNQLLRAATGQYITFLDDDDEFLDGYFEQVLTATESGADVICYDQEAVINGAVGRIECALGNPIGPFVPGGTTRRPPWFWCACRRDLAAAYRVPESFVDADGVTHHEDVLWLRHLWVEATTQTKINAVLHRYNFDSTKTTLQNTPPAFNGDHFIAGEFLRLRDKYKLTAAVETGSYEGDTTLWLARHFAKVATCELAPDKFSFCQDRFAREKLSVSLYPGSSDKLLPAIIADLALGHDTMFFLDAHTSGFVEGYCPLIQELRAIATAKLRPVIAIHDFQEPTRTLGWDTYNGQDYTLEWIAPHLDVIYGAGRWSHYHNTPDRAAGARRGIVYVEPADTTPSA
jgi:hypothetical protein